MGVATSLGLTAQRWMTYKLLDVDGGVATWCLAAEILAGMGIATALLVGVPSYMLTNRLGLTGTPRTIAACVLASIITTIAHGSMAPFARTILDHAVIPGLCLAFFGVFYMSYYRGVGAEQPNKPMQRTAFGRR